MGAHPHPFGTGTFRPAAEVRPGYTACLPDTTGEYTWQTVTQPLTGSDPVFSWSPGDRPAQWIPKPSEDGDATGGGPYPSGSAIEEGASDD